MNIKELLLKNKKYIIKFLIIYSICIVVYPELYGTAAGFCGGIYSGIGIGIKLKHELKTNPQFARKMREIAKEVQKDPAKMEQLYNDKDTQKITPDMNFLLLISVSNGLLFLILGIIIGIFLIKKYYILGFILPSICLARFAPVLGNIKNDDITLIQGIIVIIVFQYAAHFIGIYFGSRMVGKNKKVPKQYETIQNQ